MKTGGIGSTGRRAAALVLALILAAPALAVSAAGAGAEPLSIHISYSLPQGESRALYALSLEASGQPGAFWLYLPQEALAYLDTAVLEITDGAERFPGGFLPAPGQLLSGIDWLEAGLSLKDAPALEILGLGAGGETLAVFRLYISTQAQQPQPEEGPAARVSVRYFDVDGMEFSPATELVLGPGEHAVAPSPRNLPEDYELMPPALQSVHVDAGGTANPPELVFRYQRRQPSPAPDSGADLSVRYADEDGNTVAWGVPVRLEPGRVVQVEADPQLLPEGWELVGPERIEARAEGGRAVPSEALFIVRNVAPPQAPGQARPVDVPVYYVDENNIPIAQAGTVRCEPWTETVITAAPKDLPQGYTLVGAPTQTVYVDQDGASPAWVAFTYRRSGEQAAGEEWVTQAEDGPPATPIPDGFPINRWAEVTAKTVNFRREASAKSSQLGTFRQGDRIFVFEQKTVGDEVWFHVMAEGREGYVMAQYLRLFSEEESEAIQLSLPTPAPPMATPSPEPEASPTPAPVVSEPVTVTIHYVDENGDPVASPTTQLCVDGTNSVPAAPEDLAPGYVLLSDEVQFVRVAENRATPDTLRFVYTYVGDGPTPGPTPTPEPAPRIVIVNLSYRDQHGNILFSDTIPCAVGEDNVIHVNPDNLRQDPPGRYVLADAAQKTVRVGEDGVAEPEEVIFLFNDTQQVLTRQIQVFYRLENGEELAPADTELCRVGNNDIHARPRGLGEGYELLSPDPQRVSLSEDGRLTPAEVVFVYRALPAAATQPPAQTPFPYTLEPLEGWFVPVRDGINFRSSPGIADGNVLLVLSQADPVHAAGKVRVGSEVWYYAEARGQHGFIRDTVARPMTDAELAAHLGFTPSPPPSQTPSPSPVPEGEIIDRWAETTVGQLAFRTKPSGSSALAEKSRLAKGTELWVLSAVTGEEELWYSARIRGKDGYIMAKYVRLYSQEESDARQKQLKTPVPTQPPTAAPAVTLEPGPAVSEPPVPQIPTAAPATVPAQQTYQGYALTLRQVALRTGISEKDETILATLPANTLMYLWGQTRVGDTVWHSADALAGGQQGFVPDDALRRISLEEAQPYLNLIRPQLTATPSPTLPPARISGYAITLGDNVPMRSFYDTNAQIEDMLPLDTVVEVLGQEYAAQAAWHAVVRAGRYGYIRADQLRMLNELEERGYLDSLRTPTPSPEPFPTPGFSTADSPSSYGYVNTGNVRLRKEPATDAVTLKMMDANAFALVLGSVERNGVLWHRINQGGTEGYVMGNYFTVLSLGQLTGYLQSDAYLSANTRPVTVPSTSTDITPVEDFNTSVWKNPALMSQATYEPFNPVWTPAPSFEDIGTPEPSPSPGPEEELPSPVPYPEAEAGNTRGSSLGAWLAVAAVAVLGGGGAYAWYLYRDNRRRASRRAAQQRQVQQPRTPSGQPFARPAQPMQRPSPYEPPRPGAGPPRQGTVPFQGGPGAPASGTTAAFKPEQPGGPHPAREPAPNVRPAPFPPQPARSVPGAPVTPAGTRVQPPVGGPPRPAEGGPPAAPPSAEPAERPATAQRRRRSDRHTEG